MKIINSTRYKNTYIFAYEDAGSFGHIFANPKKWYARVVGQEDKGGVWCGFDFDVKLNPKIISLIRQYLRKDSIHIAVWGYDGDR